VRSTLGVSKEELCQPPCESDAVSASAMSKYMQMWHSHVRAPQDCPGPHDLVCVSTSRHTQVHVPEAVLQKHNTAYCGRNARRPICTSAKRHSTGGHLQVTSSQLPCKTLLPLSRPRSGLLQRKSACSEVGSIADNRGQASKGPKPAAIVRYFLVFSCSVRTLFQYTLLSRSQTATLLSFCICVCRTPSFAPLQNCLVQHTTAELHHLVKEIKMQNRKLYTCPWREIVYSEVQWLQSRELVNHISAIFILFGTVLILMPTALDRMRLPFHFRNAQHTNLCKASPWLVIGYSCGACYSKHPRAPMQIMHTTLICIDMHMYWSFLAHQEQMLTLVALLLGL
jgi:hypothetical protein